MKLKIVGDGVFGTFLKKELAELAEICDDADIVIMAVPFSAYEQVALQHAGAHLINVCSVQKATNDICRKYSSRVTGIHPMFGPRSPKEGRTSIITSDAGQLESLPIVRLFENFGPVFSCKDELHDQMMAKTHKQVVLISEQIQEIVNDAKDVPDFMLPTSFKRMKAMAEQFLDMSPGTKESILSNDN